MRRSLLCLAMVLGIAPQASAAIIGPVYPPPNGVSHAGSFGLGAGRDGGVTFLYDIGDFSVTSDLWWGLVSAAGPVGNGASQPLQYGSITAEGVIYDGLSPWVIPHASGVSSYDVRLLMNVYDYSGATNLNNQLVTMASVGIGPSGVVLPVTSDYRVRFEFQARAVGSLGAWDSVLDTFDSLNTFCTANCVVTSFNGQFWYEEAVTAPEPASIGLFGMVLLAMGNRVRRRWTRPAANQSTNLACS